MRPRIAFAEVSLHAFRKVVKELLAHRRLQLHRESAAGARLQRDTLLRRHPFLELADHAHALLSLLF